MPLGENARLQIAVDSAVSLVERCDHAGVTINEKGGLLTRVSSDDVVRRANELQHELGEGPRLDVMRDQDTLLSADLAQEQRWPLWAKRVRAELGVGSTMSLLVFTDRRSYGALSLYAQRGKSFDADATSAVGQALAGHLAVIMTAEREINQSASRCTTARSSDRHRPSSWRAWTSVPTRHSTTCVECPHTEIVTSSPGSPTRSPPRQAPARRLKPCPLPALLLRDHGCHIADQPDDTSGFFS